MTAQQAWYIGQRAESLAVMYLTRRDDLIVSAAQQDSGLDFLVTIKKSNGYSGRIFGIEVKATTSTNNLIPNNDNIHLIQNFDFNFLFEFPFPICLFYFTLDNDKGFYKWILEPAIEGQEYPKLRFNESHELKKITDEEIDSIILMVNQWYDSRY